MLFFKTTSYFIQYAEVLYMFFPFCDTLILNRWIPKGWFNKINNFYFLIKDILKWNWISFFFFPRKYFGSWRTWWRLMPPGASTLIHAKAPRILPSSGFCTISANVSMVKGQMTCQYYYENSFHLANPLKKPQGCGPHFEHHWSCGLRNLVKNSKVGDTAYKCLNRQGCSLNICRPCATLPDSEPLWEGSQVS